MEQVKGNRQRAKGPEIQILTSTKLQPPLLGKERAGVRLLKLFAIRVSLFARVRYNHDLSPDGDGRAYRRGRGKRQRVIDKGP